MQKNHGREKGNRKRRKEKRLVLGTSGPSGSDRDRQAFTRLRGQVGVAYAALSRADDNEFLDPFL
jgi:hypothetical protein